jgi:signal transduction histidine kinase
VAKHAHATSTVVDVALAAGVLTVTVTDNGIGMGGATRASGTANLRSRAEKWHGSCEIGPGAAGGTVVTWKAQTP